MLRTIGLRLSAMVLLWGLAGTGFAQDVTYKVGGADYEGFMAKSGTKAPVIVLIHDWDGLTQYEKDRAKMLQKQGFSVFAADLFGKGVRPTEVKDKRQHTGELYKDRKKMRSLMQGALKAARAQGMQGKVQITMGYCFGGAAALEWARSGDKLDLFASFHGGLTTPEGQSYKNTQGKVLVYHGTADSMISMEDFANLAKELEAAKVANEMVTYGGAPHSFTVFDKKAYRKDADEASFANFLTQAKKAAAM